MPQSVSYVTTDPEATQEIWKTLSNGSVDLTVESGGVVVLADAPVGVVTITLPPADSNEDRVVIVKKTDATPNVVNIDGNGSETIDGATSVSIGTQYASYTLISDGTEWHVL